MLRKQEKLHTAEISCKHIGQNSLVEPCGITVNRSKFQERPSDVVDYIYNLDIPPDNQARLEEDSLVERRLAKQFNLCIHIICGKSTGSLPCMKFIVDIRPVRMDGKPYIRVGVYEVFIQLVQRLVNQHACVDIDCHVCVGEFKRMITDIVKNAYKILYFVEARVFRNVVDIPCLALQFLAVGYQQVMNLWFSMLDFSYWFIVVQDTLNDSVLVHFTWRLNFLDRLTTLWCVCGTCQTPQKRH